MANRKLKLYVWDEFEPAIDNGLAFALARSEREAKRLVEEQYGRVFYWGEVTMLPVTIPAARAVAGAES